MKHEPVVELKHAAEGSNAGKVDVLPLTGRNPGDAFLRQEIEDNRKAERVLVLRGLIAVALVAALVVVRQVFFL
jgi:hypothetical protein